MIKFKQDTQIEVITSFDEATDKPTIEIETFKAGEKVDGEIISENGELVDVQFGDGSVSLGIQRNLFEIL